MKKIILIVTFCLLCVSLTSQEQITENVLSLQDAIALYEDDKTKIPYTEDRVIELVKSLVTQGIHAGSFDDNAILYASRYGYTEIVKSLIAADADSDAKDSAGWTALIHAASGGYAEIIKVLTDEDVNLESKQQDGNTALILAAVLGHTEAVTALIEAGANFDAQNNYGNTALILAAAFGHTEVAKALIDAGANLELKNNRDNTALIFATAYGHTEVAKALIEADANLDVQDDEGNTASILATQEGHIEVAKTLIEADANIDMQDDEGNTALKATTSNEHTEIVSLQKKAGASEYNIGDRGSGGGLIFYIYPEGDRYLECSENIGTANWNDAKALAKNYRSGGYDDWFLPNKEELNYIYENLRTKRFLSDDDWFWSSSEYRSDGAWLQNFNSGSQICTYKSYDVSNVLVARAFNY